MTKWCNHFFHPLKAARQTAELLDLLKQHETYSDSVEKEINEAHEIIESLRQRVSEYEEKEKKSQSVIQFLERQLVDTRNELSELREELNDANDALEQLDEIHQLILKFEQQKAKYQQRISQLKEALNDARSAEYKSLKNHTDSNIELEAINFTSSPNCNTPTKITEPTREKSALPPTTPSLFTEAQEDSCTVVPNSGPTDKSADTRPDTSSDDDWLKPLPDHFL